MNFAKFIRTPFYRAPLVAGSIVIEMRRFFRYRIVKFLKIGKLQFSKKIVKEVVLNKGWGRDCKMFILFSLSTVFHFSAVFSRLV